MSEISERMPTICLKCGEAIPHDQYPAHVRFCDSKTMQYRVENDDLRWLVGWLGIHAPATLLLPPRLAPLVAECVEACDLSRYTLAVPNDAGSAGGRGHHEEDER